MPRNISKKDLPQEMKVAFKGKPYDIWAISKYIGTHVGYMGYDVYQVRGRMVRGRELIKIVARRKARVQNISPATRHILTGLSLH